MWGTAPTRHLYPFGFPDTHAQVSLHMSSIVNCASQPSLSFAHVGIATNFATSPGLRPAMTFLIVRPEARSNAATSSSTEVPFPVPKLIGW